MYDDKSYFSLIGLVESYAQMYAKVDMSFSKM